MIRACAVVLAAGMLSVAACGLPERDNLLDPANAVSVEVDVVDLGASDDPLCTATAAVTATNRVFAASRGDCLAIVATVVDSHGAAVTGVEFTVLTTDGSAVPVGTPLASEGRVALLDEQFRHEHHVGVAHPFRVRVTSRKGVGAADVPLILLDSAPEARVTGPKLLPLGGWPWALGAPFATSFGDGGSTDADAGDPLSYCWTVDGIERPCSGALESPVTLPSDRLGRRIGSLRVEDGIERSGTVFQEISVGRPGGWLVKTYDPQRWRRFDPDEQRFAPPSDISFQAVFTVVSRPGEPAVTVRAYKQTLTDVAVVQLVDGDATADFGAPLLLTGNGAEGTFVKSLAASPTTGELRLKSTDQNGNLFVHSIALQESAGNLVLSDPGITSSLGHPPAIVDDLVVDELGTSWLPYQASAFEAITRLQRVAPGGSVVEVETNDSAAISGIGARPASETGEVWWLRTPLDASVDAEVSVAGTATGLRTRTLPHALTHLVFADATSFWSFSALDGLVLLDADALMEGPYETAILERHPEITDADRIFVDPRSGRPWILGSAGTTHLSLDGRVLTSPPSNLQPLFVDDLGMVWCMESVGGGWRRTRATSDDSIAFSVTLPDVLLSSSEAPGVLDPLTDGGWFPAGSLLPFGLAHTGPQGRIDRVITHVVDGDTGERTGWQPLQKLHMTNDGTRVVAFDTSDPPRLVSLELGSAGDDPDLLTWASDATPYFTHGVFPANPWVAGSGDFAWAFHATTKQLDIVTPSDGVATSIAVLPDPNLFQVNGAVFPRTNDLCFVTLTGPSGMPLADRRWSVFSIPAPTLAVPSPVPLLLDTITVPHALQSDFRLSSVATAVDASGDLCWVVLEELNYNNPPVGSAFTLLGYRQGVPGAAFEFDAPYAAGASMPGYVTSINAGASKDLWLTVDDTPDAFNSLTAGKLLHLVFTTGMGPALTDTIPLDGTDYRFVRQAGETFPMTL